MPEEPCHAGWPTAELCGPSVVARAWRRERVRVRVRVRWTGSGKPVQNSSGDLPILLLVSVLVSANV